MKTDLVGSHCVWKGRQFWIAALYLEDQGSGLRPLPILLIKDCETLKLSRVDYSVVRIGSLNSASMERALEEGR